jgi:hypothetical protein
MTIRWWARFRVPLRISDEERRIVHNSERESFASLLDVTDVCASDRMSAEVWYETTESETAEITGERIYVGWIDELGRVRARRRDSYGARKLATVIAASLCGITEIEECSVEVGLSVGVVGAYKVTGFEVWSVRSRKGEGSSVYPFDRFPAAEVRVG